MTSKRSAELVMGQRLNGEPPGIGASSFLIVVGLLSGVFIGTCCRKLEDNERTLVMASCR